MPTLVVGGTHDMGVPRHHFDALVRGIPGAPSAIWLIVPATHSFGLTRENLLVSWARNDHDGRAAARKRGVHMGRKPKLSELQRRVARERVAKGESARAIAQERAVG